MSGGREILIIEDNPADVRLLREALASLDPPANVHVTSDGEQAVRFLRREDPYTAAPQPTLVFLDFNLPRIDSRELLKFIKREQQLRNVIVSVLTSSNSEEVIREAYDLKANCYLSKPSDLDGFMHTIRSAAAYFLNVAAAHPEEESPETSPLL